MARVALVTGGTRGIGAAISRHLKEAGYSVAANYAGNDEAANAFKADTGIPVFKFDVSECRGLRERHQGGGGRTRPGRRAGQQRGHHPRRHLPPDDLRSMVAGIRTNLNSMFTCTRPVIEGMRDRGFGRIILISSVNGQKGQLGQTNYSAAKAGVVGFAKALALGNANKGITVNVIAPGYIATEMVQAVPEEVLKTKILPLIPVGRLGEAEEIARAVVFLAADDAGFITGLDAHRQWRPVHGLIGVRPPRCGGTTASPMR